MHEVRFAWHEVEIYAHVGLRRQIESMKGSLTDRHGYTGEGWNIHIEGAGGEMAVAKLLGRYWDGGVGTFKRADLGGKIQVRTRSRDDYDLIVRPEDSDNDFFVLVRGRTPKFTVVGYILGKAAKRDEWLKDYGGRPPAYFVPVSALRAFAVA